MKILEWFLCALIAGCLFASVHVANLWIFSNLSLTAHIAWIYVPAFLRLANVIVLGAALGAIGTFFGGLILIWIQNSDFLLALPNTFISAGAASFALWIFTITANREFDMNRLWDWLQLTIYCSLVSVTLHHVYWFWADSSQIIEPNQFAIMMFGDVTGTLLGAWMLRLLSKRLKVILKNKIDAIG